MAKARGRIMLPEERQDRLRSMLMWHYEGNEEFMRDLAWLLYVYERLIEALVRPLDRKPRHPDVGTHEHENLAWKALDAAIRWKGRNAHLRSYRRKLKALCDKWGLGCDWAAPWVHASLLEYVQVIVPAEQLEAEWDQIPPSAQTAILRMAPRHTWRSLKQLRCRFRRWLQSDDEEMPSLPSLVSTRYTSHDPVSQWLWDKWQEKRWSLRSAQSLNRRIRIEIEYEPFLPGRQEDAEKAVVKEFRRQWEESKAQYLQAGFILQNTEPELFRHVHWLYQRIALKKVPKQIALEESVGQDAVEKAIYQLARALSLRLPRNRGVSVRR